MKNEHHYNTSIVWTGNRGTGTSSYRDYARSYDLSAPGKPLIAGSSDATFRGEASKWNPEDMLLASLSSCHMLSYLHLCADAGISVIAYSDNAEGTMQLTPDGSGHFTSVTLHPQVTIAAGHDLIKADALHHRAHELCFIANSVNFPVACEATTTHAANDSRDI
ncbi:OsmC family protein [Terriglobus sp. RCC_193]|uniref:OsmC family protein n=1 Tax=Terriglobus sp. RCC_193 TaxID=3239218 RepID=UPI00352504C6